jgi:hypothetical protein
MRLYSLSGLRGDDAKQLLYSDLVTALALPPVLEAFPFMSKVLSILGEGWRKLV